MTAPTHWKPEGDLETPYLRARQEWDARMGSALAHARNWRLAALVSQGAVIVALVGLVVLGAQPKAVPHIIEVDRLGAAVDRGPVGLAARDYTPPDAVLKYHLRRFIEDTRSLSSDAAVLRKNWLDAYALVTPRAARMLSATVQAPAQDPFQRAQDETVAVELLSAVRVSADTWQLDWRETTTDKSGARSGAPTVWRGMFHVLLLRPKTEEQMSQNPLGLYIDEFHWDKVQG
jgi:type IV secretion system protein VirB5